jgi:hypothetical protein
VGVVAVWDFPGQGVETPQKTAAQQKAERLFLQLLAKFNDRSVTVSAEKSAPNNAPSVFADEPEAKAAKLGSEALRQAMNRLLDSNQIHVEGDPKGRTKGHLQAGPRIS